MKHSFNDLQKLQGQDFILAVEEVVTEAAYDLPNKDAISSLTASTNALGWGLDEIEIDYDSIYKDVAEITGSANFSLSGEQDEDRMYYGNTISGTLDFSISTKDGISFSNIEAHIDHDEE